jgi:glyoxylase-like metal-dependent hydrolase (beta-lactamase superfamily II)
MMDRIPLGNASLTRVLELQFEFPAALFPQTPQEAWQENAEELAPTFYDPGTEQCRVAMQSWVVEVDGLTVVIDTGVGNDRERPHLHGLGNLSTDFLGALQRADIDPTDVDVVINTHLHTDHVGWNTRLVDGSWVPTFPNARYLIAEADYRYFSPDGAGSGDGLDIVFADSVLPVGEQIETFAGDHPLSDSLWLRPAPGHTPGSTVVWLDAGTPAVFVGDLTHCPIQIARPGDPCVFDVNPDEATATRQRIFTEASRRRAAVIPAHYPGRGGATIVARGDRFEVDDWLDLESI